MFDKFPKKSQVSEQLCRVAAFGVKDANAFNAISPLADEHGRLWVRTIDPIPFIISNIQNSSPPSGSLVQAASVFGFGPLRIVNVSGYNANATQLFVMLFDTANVPVLNDVPQITIPVPGTFTSFSYGAPFIMLNGLGIAISSTQFAYTPVVPASLSYVAIIDRGGPTP